MFSTVALNTKPSRSELKPFKYNPTHAEAAPAFPVPAISAKPYPEVPATSARWIRVPNVGYNTVPFVGRGEPIAPYFGWLLEVFDVEAVDVESETGCYTVLYAYDDVPWRADVDSRMFVIFRPRGVDDFRVMDGYDVFLPDDAESMVINQSSGWVELSVEASIAAIGTLFHVLKEYHPHNVLQHAWSKKATALNYYHDADRGAWDPKR